MNASVDHKFLCSPKLPLMLLNSLYKNGTFFPISKILITSIDVVKIINVGGINLSSMIRNMTKIFALRTMTSSFCFFHLNFVELGCGYLLNSFHN